jgi:hypothetical protein
MDWTKIVSDTLTADFAGIEGIRDFSEIIAEIDAKPAGWILDRATTLMREIYASREQGDLEASYTLVDFLKRDPLESHPSEKNNITNFDPTELFVRTFGYVSNFIDMGKNGYLLPARLADLEQAFEKGYVFLRAAHILSQKV